jgi:hypothetical protein
MRFFRGFAVGLILFVVTIEILGSFAPSQAGLPKAAPLSVATGSDCLYGSAPVSVSEVYKST